MKLAGSVALVTGASRGIGRETVLALGRAGVSVAAVARGRPALESLAAEAGEGCLALPADLSRPEDIDVAVGAALAHFGRVDILVNNAGMLSNRDFLETDPAVLLRTVDLNYRAAVHLTRLLAPGMAERRRGHIVNVSSLAGISGIPGEAVYSGSKAALRLFTASLRPELTPRRIFLTDMVLGFVSTEMLAEVESNPRVEALFNRARALRMMVDIPAATVGEAIADAIARRREVVVLPARARPLYLPFQGLTRAIVRRLAPR